MVMTPPEALISSSCPLLNPAFRLMARGNHQRNFVVVLDGDGHRNDCAGLSGTFIFTITGVRQPQRAVRRRNENEMRGLPIPSH